jgi:hypothetical protein
LHFFFSRQANPTKSDEGLTDRYDPVVIRSMAKDLLDSFDDINLDHMTPEEKKSAREELATLDGLTAIITRLCYKILELRETYESKQYELKQLISALNIAKTMKTSLTVKPEIPQKNDYALGDEFIYDYFMSGNYVKGVVMSKVHEPNVTIYRFVYKDPLSNEDRQGIFRIPNGTSFIISY